MLDIFFVLKWGGSIESVRSPNKVFGCQIALMQYKAPKLNYNGSLWSCCCHIFSNKKKAQKKKPFSIPVGVRTTSSLLRWQSLKTSIETWKVKTLTLLPMHGPAKMCSGTSPVARVWSCQEMCSCLFCLLWRSEDHSCSVYFESHFHWPCEQLSKNIF